MPAAIFITFVVIELALLGYSLTTKSRRERARSVVRLTAFVGLAVLLATPLVEWSWRWAGVAVLLFALAARGVWRLLRPSRLDGEFKAGPAILRAVVVVLLALLAIAPALIFPPYQPLAATGPYPVATARHTYIDESRIETYSDSREHRQVNLTCWYPQTLSTPERFPLVVFSHGGLGLETGNESLFLELASHGYVVCSIGHPYHAFWTRDVDGHLARVDWDYLQDSLREDPRRDKEESLRLYREWLATRTADIGLVIDTLVREAAGGTGGVYGRVDGQRIGVMGHSLGGSAALAMPRQRDGIGVVIALESPLLGDITGVENGAFVWDGRPYPVPVLNIYSDSAWDHLGEWAQYEGNHALLADERATVMNLHLPGAGHFSLTDLALTSPLLVRLLEGGPPAVDSAAYLRAVNRAGLEFLDTHLKGAAGER